MVLFVSAGPGPPVVNGIFEVCHWTWASFLTQYCRRPLQFLSFSSRFPRAAGSESLECSYFTFPLREICFKMSVCSRSVFYWEVLRKWLRLEFLSPYLRLFSFCDYTIQYSKEFVYSQISQTKYELFVHVIDRYCLDECGIINMLGVQKRGPVGWQAHAF